MNIFIVYYASREEKTWTVHSPCKQEMYGLPNFPSLLCILIFFIIPEPKIPHSRLRAESESGTFGQGIVKKFSCLLILLIVNLLIQFCKLIKLNLWLLNVFGSMSNLFNTYSNIFILSKSCSDFTKFRWKFLFIFTC